MARDRTPEVIDLTATDGHSPISVSDAEATPQDDPVDGASRKGRRKKKTKRRDHEHEPETDNGVLPLASSKSPLIFVSDDEGPINKREFGGSKNKRRKESNGRAELEEGEVDISTNGAEEQLHRDDMNGRHVSKRRNGGESSTKRSRDVLRDDEGRRKKDKDGEHRDYANGHKRKRGRSVDDGDRERRRKNEGKPSRRSPSPVSVFFVDTQPADLPSEYRVTAPKLGSSSDVELIDRKADDLILPAHVTISDLVGDSAPMHIQPTSPADSEEEDFIRYMDYDDTQKGLIRYFDNAKEETSKQKIFVCKHCGAEGDHKTYECPVMICLTCGARNEHSTRGCPISKTCFSCGMKGHISQDCSQRYSARGEARLDHLSDCDRCGSDLHKANECPTLWRMYEYVSDAQREAILKSRKGKELLALGDGGEGYIGDDEWCYHCGGDGHLGDDCNEVEYPQDFPIESSAFSLYNTLSGPFADPDTQKPPRQRRGLREWEMDGMFDDGHGFAGPTDVGKKGKDKERARMRKHAKDVEEAEDDEDDWFGNRRGRNASPARPRSSTGGQSHSGDKDRRRDKKPVMQLSIKGQAGRYDARPPPAPYSMDGLPDRPRGYDDKRRDRRRGYEHRSSNELSRGDVRFNGNRGDKAGRQYHGGYGR